MPQTRTQKKPLRPPESALIHRHPRSESESDGRHFAVRAVLPVPVGLEACHATPPTGALTGPQGLVWPGTRLRPG